MNQDLSQHTPLVSVIMAAYNVENFIAEAIQSIVDQTYTNWELIIADDCSKDSTREVIEKFTKKDPRIIYFKLDTNSGQATARNLAIERSKGNYLAILDADDVSLPQRLEKQVSFLESHKDIAIVGSEVLLINEEGKKLGVKGKPEKDYQIRFPLLLQTQFVHSSVMMRKEIFQNLGGYDTKYLYAEDYDLWSRLSTQGFALANVQETLIKYRMQPNSVTQMSSTQPIQEKHSLEINFRNISPYIACTMDDIVKLMKFVNNRPQNILNTLKSITLYKKLVYSYIKKQQKKYDNEDAYILQLYKEKRNHSLKVLLKGMLGI